MIIAIAGNSHVLVRTLIIIVIKQTYLITKPHLDGTRSVSARLKNHDEQRAAIQKVSEFLPSLHRNWLADLPELLLKDD